MRVAQEALHNVKKHAGAKTVNVQLEYLPEEIALEVRDDGRGFEAMRRARGVAGRALWFDGHAGAGGGDRGSAGGAVGAGRGRDGAAEGASTARGRQRRKGAGVSQESIRVLVVEDHHVVRQGLVALLKVAGGIEVVGEAADGVEAIAQFRKHQPAITLIDLRLPRLAGVEVIERIRMETPQRALLC